MKRNEASRKGNNGIVAVIGGSIHIHGAPLFAALAAEASGVDLIYACVPECHAEVTKAASPNFFVTPFRGDDLSKSDVSALEEIVAECDTAVIGPGLATYETTQKAIQSLIKDIPNPLVLDASALQPWTFDLLQEKQAIITPHPGELGRMQGQVYARKSDDDLKDVICTIAKARGITAVLKGATDIIAGGEEGKCQEVKGGNAGLTVGGTGDVLAGLIAGLVAQGIEHFDACIMATTIIKRAATVLHPEKGYAFTAMDVIRQIPHLVHTYDQTNG